MVYAFNCISSSERFFGAQKPFRRKLFERCATFGLPMKKALEKPAKKTKKARAKMKKPSDKKVKGQRQSVILSANLKEQQQLENHVEGVNVKTFFRRGQR